MIHELTYPSTAFGYLREEHIIRLYRYFREKRLNKKYVPQLASQFGVPEPVVVEFAKWMAQREIDPPSADVGCFPQLALLTDKSLQTTPQSSVAPHLHSSSPIGTPPQNAGFTSHDPIKMEIDEEAAASLPTPQRSVEPPVDLVTSSKTSSSEPSIMTFYDAWIQSRPASLTTTSTASSDGPPSAILERHLPVSLTQFAFGSSTAV